MKHQLKTTKLKILKLKTSAFINYFY